MREKKREMFLTSARTRTGPLLSCVQLQRTWFGREIERLKAKGQIRKVIGIAFFNVHEQGSQRREEEDCGKRKVSRFFAGDHGGTEQGV